ncbi:MAG: membrane dipeptidase [Pseudomonadota bacterium]
MKKTVCIDGLQYVNWHNVPFEQLKGVDAIHVTIAYHEDFRETVTNIQQWNQWFEQFNQHLLHGLSGQDVRCAHQSGRTAVFFGLQNPSPIEQDVGLVEVLHTLGVRFMQLSYNNQSLLASGCYEKTDGGITHMGEQVIKEMNRVGMVVDMSHSGERSTLEAIELSSRPIAITHANPADWHSSPRNKSDTVLKALAHSGGILGLSAYPLHLASGSHCTLEAYCAMVAQVIDIMGVDHVALGTDLCQGQPDEVLRWMRYGRWMKQEINAKAENEQIRFPDMPHWFQSNRDFVNIEAGLRKQGIDDESVGKIMGENWLRFFDHGFQAAHHSVPLRPVLDVSLTQRALSRA